MAKHLGSANGASCLMLTAAVSHCDAVGVVMGFLFCNLLRMWETLEGKQGMRGAELGVLFVLYKLAVCGNRGTG